MNMPLLDIPLHLKTYIEHLTTKSGVYRMMNEVGDVIYVGKAFNLKKRISSYFSKKTSSEKTRALVNQIARIDVRVTQSETEALLLESSLIKSLQPKYNVLLRDDKSYPFIRINEHAFPRIESMRCKKKPKQGCFFGPYPSTTAVKETLQIVHKVFKIRGCQDSYFNHRTRPCLQYQIKRCSAPCTGYISKEAYQRSIRDAMNFLQGKSSQILQDLEARMDLAVKELAFEEAALLRDQIKSLRLIQEQQGIVQSQGDADVVAMDVQGGLACIHWVSVRNGLVGVSRNLFPSVPANVFEGLPNETVWQDLLTAFISCMYVDTSDSIPPLIILNRTISEQKSLEVALSTLRGKSCRIQTKPRGMKARWLDFAQQNLQQAFNERLLANDLIRERYKALQNALHLPKPITWMECFDVSHTQGSLTVASCVVYDEFGPSRQHYRRFNIKNITPGDDYAALEQALTRRFKTLQVKASYPDVLIIDGGKGQVRVASRVLNVLNIHDVILLGVAKGPSRKSGVEHFFLANASNEMVLDSDSPARLLIQSIRDEAHRFAITFHRNKRHKAHLHSQLEDIPGVGVKRRQALLRRFGGLRELAKAPLEEIAKVQGISRILAARIHQHLSL